MLVAELAKLQKLTGLHHEQPEVVRKGDGRVAHFASSRRLKASEDQGEAISRSSDARHSPTSAVTFPVEQELLESTGVVIGHSKTPATMNHLDDEVDISRNPNPSVADGRRKRRKKTTNPIDDLFAKFD